MDFLRQQGIRYSDLEASGLISPIFEIKCRYRRMVRFEDTVAIVVRVEKYTGVKITGLNTEEGILRSVTVKPFGGSEQVGIL